MSPALRGQLEHLVDEVECSTCGGSRLRDDAGGRAAPRSHDRRDLPPAAGRAAGRVASLEARQATSKKSPANCCAKSQPPAVPGRRRSGVSHAWPGRRRRFPAAKPQRIRLASQVGSGLCGVLYVLDEPTIGLHPRDNRRLLGALAKLRDLGNTLLVVEHDREVVSSADQLLDFGPAAGEFGGQIVARGTPAKVAKRATRSQGRFLSGKKAIPVPTNRQNRARVRSGGVRKWASRPRNGKRQEIATSAAPNVAQLPNSYGSKSSVRGTTICATSPCEFRWAR